MHNRSAVQTLWRAARGGLARLNAILAEPGAADDAVFRAPTPAHERTGDAERRINEARRARIPK